MMGQVHGCRLWGLSMALWVTIVGVGWDGLSI